MGALKLKHNYRRKEVRVEDRYQRIKGLWQKIGSDQQVPLRIVDLSSDGFGMLVETRLDNGAQIRATFSLPSVLVVDATVVWSKSDPEQGGWRIGLCCDRHGSRKLEAIYRQIISSSSEIPSLILQD